MTYTTFDSMPLVLDVIDIADTLGIGRNKAYSLVNSGTIRALKIGQQYRIPRENLIRYIESAIKKSI